MLTRKNRLTIASSSARKTRQETWMIQRKYRCTTRTNHHLLEQKHQSRSHERANAENEKQLYSIMTTANERPMIKLESSMPFTESIMDGWTWKHAKRQWQRLVSPGFKYINGSSIKNTGGSQSNFHAAATFLLRFSGLSEKTAEKLEEQSLSSKFRKYRTEIMRSKWSNEVRSFRPYLPNGASVKRLHLGHLPVAKVAWSTVVLVPM